MGRALAAAIGLLAACAGHDPTVETGGESRTGSGSGAEARIDALLEALDDAVAAEDESAYERLSDGEGRRAVARLLVAQAPALLEATRGTGDAARLAFLVGAVFGAHVDPLVAMPVNGVGLALLRASGQATPERVAWLFPHVDEAATALPGSLSEDAIARGLATQRRGSLAALRAAGLGRCVRGTYLQSFGRRGELFPGPEGSWGSQVERVWVARLDCMRDVGMFLFAERVDGSLRLLGFRFLTDEAHRDALAILESIEARVAPE